MKTSEFIKRVGALGYEVFGEFGETRVCRDNSIFARVSKDEVNKLDTLWEEDVPYELFDLLVEYARTPIDEREEPKRYYLRPKGMKLIRTNFVFNYYVNDGDWSLYGKDETRLAKTRFTLKELEDLGINPEHYDLEEVE